MIYTIGLKKNYSKYFREIPGLKKDTGGSVWKYYFDARSVAEGSDQDFGVYGVLADWDDDTLPSPEGSFRSLSRPARLVDLPKMIDIHRGFNSKVNRILYGSYLRMHRQGARDPVTILRGEIFLDVQIETGASGPMGLYPDLVGSYFVRNLCLPCLMPMLDRGSPA